MIVHRRPPLLFFLTLLAGLFGIPGLVLGATRAGVVIDPVAGAGQVTPGIGSYGVYNISVQLPGPDDPAAGFVSGRKAAHCIEPDVRSLVGTGTLRTGVEGADLSLAGSDPANLAILPGGRDRLEWLLLSSRRAVADAPSDARRNFEAAAHQRAIFLLISPTNGGPDEPGVQDPALIARSLELLDQSARFGQSIGQPPAVMAVGADVCGGTNRTIRLSGAPFTSVTLNLSSPTGTWTGGGVVSGAGRVLTVKLGADGTADASVSAPPGVIAIDATFDVPTLVQAELPDTKAGGQDFAYLEFQPLRQDLSVRFIDCTPPVAPVGVMVTPGVATTPPPAGALTLTKSAPQTLRGRTITYTIVVRNPSTVPVPGVTLRDAIPAGMTLPAVPRRARLSKGVIHWDLGTLAPGARVTVRVQMRADANVTRTRCNVVRASGSNAPTVSARACTRFFLVAGATFQPVVTG
jgi:uncharacterized repeat protein (TIGR01451 family)